MQIPIRRNHKVSSTDKIVKRTIHKRALYIPIKPQDPIEEKRADAEIQNQNDRARKPLKIKTAEIENAFSGVSKTCF